MFMFGMAKATAAKVARSRVVFMLMMRFEKVRVVCKLV
jgi:hypothetical protein